MGIHGENSNSGSDISASATVGETKWWERMGVCLRAHRVTTILICTFLLAFIPSVLLLYRHFDECPDKKFQVGYSPELEECFCENTMSRSRLKTLFAESDAFASSVEVSLGHEDVLVGANDSTAFRAWAAAEDIDLPAFKSADGSMLYVGIAIPAIPMSFWDDLMTGTRIKELDFDAIPLVIKYGTSTNPNHNYPLSYAQNGESIFKGLVTMSVGSTTTQCATSTDAAEDDVGSGNSGSYDGACREWLSPPVPQSFVYNATDDLFITFETNIGLDTPNGSPAEWASMAKLHTKMQQYVADKLRPVFATDDVSYCTPSHCLASDCFGLELFKVFFLIGSAASLSFNVALLFYWVVERKLFPLLKHIPDTTFSTSSTSDRDMAVFSA